MRQDPEQDRQMLPLKTINPEEQLATQDEPYKYSPVAQDRQVLLVVMQVLQIAVSQVKQ